MPALKCSVGIQRKSGSGFQPLRRGKMPHPLFGAEPRNLADIVSRDPVDQALSSFRIHSVTRSVVTGLPIEYTFLFIATRGVEKTP